MTDDPKGSIIPKMWAKQIIEDLNRESRWNAYCDSRGYEYAKLPVSPFRTRARKALLLLVARTRERIALKIAPWLEENDPYG